MKNRDGAFYVYWDAKRGILLYFDTYGDNINGGKFAYNWIPRDRQAAYRYTSSGGFEKHNDGMVWVGYHSCGGGNIDVNIKNLEENGEFVVPWVGSHFCGYYTIRIQRNMVVVKNIKKSMNKGLLCYLKIYKLLLKE